MEYSKNSEYMNILELTGMKSTKYGGVESYFAELVKICRVDKFILYTSRCQSVKTM